MTQYISKSALVAEFNRLIAELVEEGEDTMFEQGRISAFEDAKLFLDTLEVNDVDAIHPIDDVVSNNTIANTLEISRHGNPHIGDDLEEVATKYAQDKYLPVQTWQAFKEGAKWKEANLWKNAQGDDLPEIDREVIVLVKSLPEYEDSILKVSFAHRPPERWYGRNLDGEEHVFEPKTYDKGEWNIPNVIWWLDLDLPIKGE